MNCRSTGKGSAYPWKRQTSSNIRDTVTVRLFIFQWSSWLVAADKSSSRGNKILTREKSWGKTSLALCHMVSLPISSDRSQLSLYDGRGLFQDETWSGMSAQWWGWDWFWTMRYGLRLNPHVLTCCTFYFYHLGRYSAFLRVFVPVIL